MRLRIPKIFILLLICIFGFSSLVPVTYAQSESGDDPHPDPPCRNSGQNQDSQDPYDKGSPSDPHHPKDGDPVNLFTGAYAYQHQDFHIAARGMDIDFTRFYSSDSNQTAPFGSGWSHSYAINLIGPMYMIHRGFQGSQLPPNNPSRITRKNSDGSRDDFIRQADGRTYKAVDPGCHYSIVRYDQLPADIAAIAPAGILAAYVVSDTHGKRWLFDEDGCLRMILDRNYNKITFEYNKFLEPIILGGLHLYCPRFQLTAIYDTLDRKITINYNGYLIDTITDFTGKTVQYSYQDVNSSFRAGGYNTSGSSAASGAGIKTEWYNTYVLTAAATGYTTTQETCLPPIIGRPPQCQQNDIFNSLGATVNYGYTWGKLTSVSDPNGNIYITNTYGTQGLAQNKVVEQNYGPGRYIFNYVSSSKVITTDPNGNITDNYLDAQGSLVRKVRHTRGLRSGDPAAYTTYYTYNDARELIGLIYPKGNSLVNTYDIKGNLLTTTRNGLPGLNETPITSAYTYEPRYNFVKTATDANGNVTTYYYDYEENSLSDLNGDGITNQAHGNLIKIAGPETGDQRPETSYTYNNSGQMQTSTDPAGTVTKYEYTSEGYVSRIIADYGGDGHINAVTSFTYDNRGNVLTVTDPLNHTTVFTYDAFNRLTGSTGPTGLIAKYTYDTNGSLIKLERQADPAATQWQTTEYAYDILDRLIKVIQRPMTDNQRLTIFAYDLNGNRSSVTDADGNVTFYQYDERNKLYKTTDALGSATQYDYDSNANLSKITDANNNPTQYQYDGFDRLVKTVYPNASFELYFYDSNSNLISKRNRKGQAIAYAYDSLNRLTAKTYPDSTAINYAYDLASRLISLTGGEADISYQYDALNRVIQTAATGRQIFYEYDKAGNRTKLTYPDSSFITYSYDNLNRLTQISDSGGGAAIAGYSYDTLSRRTGLDLANNTRTTYAYDNLNRLLNLANQINGGGAISNFAYSYDKVGNRLSKTNAAGTEAYGYDAIYQLTQVTDPASQVTSYNYDKLGNRVTAEGKSYTANNLNQYTVVDTNSLAYDSNGNLQNANGWTYSYDYENRLIGATNGTTTASYGYDPFGRRIQKTVGSVTTNYLWDDDNLIAEYDATGALQKKYIFGQNIDEPILMQSGSDKYYYHSDALGSITEISNASGNVVEKYSYDAYGKTAIKDAADNSLTESAIGNHFGFTGRDLDNETGLYFYRARYYSPSLGRFLQADSIGYYDSMNLYKYCSNNPTRHVDPYGKFLVEVAVGVMGVGALIGFLWWITSQMVDKYNKMRELQYDPDYFANGNDTKACQIKKLSGQVQILSGSPSVIVEAYSAVNDPAQYATDLLLQRNQPSLVDAGFENIGSGLEDMGYRGNSSSSNTGNNSTGNMPK